MPVMIITFVLHFLPVSKSNSYKSTRKGSFYKPSKVVIQEQAIKAAALQALPVGWQPSLKGWHVDATFHYADKRRRDLDGHEKILYDSLNKIVWEDDSQIMAISIRKILGCKVSKTVVTLSEI